MGVSAYIDSVALATSTSNTTVSPGSLSFTPAGLFVALNPCSSDGGQPDARLTVGAAASSSDRRTQAFESEDASASADVGILATNTAFISGMIDNNASDFTGDFISFNSGPNGFTYALSDTPLAAYIMPYLLLGGDVTVQTGVMNLGTGNGNKSISSLSGTPEAVIFFTCGALTASDTQTATTGNGTTMLGVMCADGTQWVAGTRHTDAAGAGDTARWHHTSRCIDLRTVSADLVNAAFVSMDANGFTVNATVTTSNIRVYFMAIYGGHAQAGSYLRAPTGSEQVTTTGVTPKLLMMQSVAVGNINTTQIDGNRSFGMTDGSRQWAVAYGDTDAADPTVADSYLDRSHIVSTITAGTPTVTNSVALTSLDAEGFTVNHDVATGSSVRYFWFVLGDTFTAGGTILQPRRLTLLGVS